MCRLTGSGSSLRPGGATDAAAAGLSMTKTALVYDEDVRLLSEFLWEATQHGVYHEGTQRACL